MYLRISHPLIYISGVLIHRWHTYVCKCQIKVKNIINFRQTAPHSIVTLKPLLTFGHNKTDAEIKRYLRVSNAVWHWSDHLNYAALHVNACSGCAILAKLLIKRR